MRTFTAAFKRAMFAPQTGDAVLHLLTITHPSVGVPLRFVNNMVDIVSRGSTYLATAFQLTLPDEREDQIPRVGLSIDNVHQTLVATVRTITTPPLVVLEVVLGSAPDTVETGPFNFTLRNVDYVAASLAGELAFEDFINETYPSASFSPGAFPGLFMVMLGLGSLLIQQLILELYG